MSYDESTSLITNSAINETTHVIAFNNRRPTFQLISFFVRFIFVLLSILLIVIFVQTLRTEKVKNKYVIKNEFKQPTL